MSVFIDTIVNGLQSFFGNAYLTVFFVSMIPMIEVRGAIPIAIKLGINPVSAYIFSAVSALIICPILILFLKPVLNLLKKTKIFHKIGAFVESKFSNKAKDIEAKAELSEQQKVEKNRKLTLLKALGLYLFVAFPLPMTGVWTGSAIAAFINLKYRYSIPAIVLGNFTAAGIIALLTYILGDNSFYILIILFVFILITVVATVLSIIRKGKKTS